MDIFDTFFLVEYLRQWAGRGRIVIMTLLPPTYEILTMISKIVLISMGKLMYFGKRREMLPYFAFIEYPCPAYKNPADYYRKSSKKLILDIKHFLSYLNSASQMITYILTKNYLCSFDFDCILHEHCSAGYFALKIDKFSGICI